MIKHQPTRLALFGTTALTAAAFAFSAPAAHAQEGSAAENAAEEEVQTFPDSELATIVVTGSRIRRDPNVESPVPVASISGDELFETGSVSVGDVLNELPALRSTFSQQNSTRFLGTGGLNLLDLRGLGTNRTLVLQNGRRHVGSDVLGDGVAVDANSIPSELVERIDIITGGSSAVYGSDAITGVINFVMKDDYEGVQLRAQNGISKYGDGNAYFISGMAGTNFGDGRGNIVLHGEYAHQEDLYGPDRPHTSQLNTYLTVDEDDLDDVNGSDGIPDRVFYEDIRYGYYANGGTVFAFGPGFSSLIPYIFQPDGSLVIQTGERIDDIDFAPVPLFLGGNGDNFRDGKQFGLMPELDRYAINLLGHFEVSPAVVPFFEAKYVRSDALSNNSGPFFTLATGSPRENFFTTNPYLNADAADFIRNIYGVYSDIYDADCNFTYGYDADDNLYYGDGTFDSDQCGFAMYRSVTDLGNREEDAKRETYRIVAGVRGDLSDHWNYEVSANYGEHKNRTRILGNVNIQRYLLAIDAVDEGDYLNGTPNGNIVCRSQIDGTAAAIYEFADEEYATSLLAADVAACVPANLFGEGNLDPASRAYIVQDTSSTGKITQFVLNGYVAGDTSGFFELPGGPVAMAFGGEYRRETLLYKQDALTDAGLTFYNQIPTFDPPSFEVKELFAELEFPILRDLPGAEQLTVNLAGRYADYKGSTGGVFAYNGTVQYSPIEDITFRANYSRAVRAPNLADQFTPLGANFARNFEDPCAATNLVDGSEFRVANCLADGVPEGFDYSYFSSLQFQSGGNPELKEETSTSFIVGAVLEPRFIPGLSLSVDYYDIKIDDVITSPSAQQIVDACYDASDLDNQFCDLFERQGPGVGPRGEIEGRILENSLEAKLLNYAQLRARGIDVNLGYRQFVGAIGGDFTARVNYTRALQLDEFLDPTDPGRANQLLFELGDPKDSLNANFGVDLGKFSLGYQFRYIGKMVLNAYEDTYSKQGRPPQDADYAEDRYYKSVTYHDIRGEFDVNDKFSFYVGVDNVGNQLPVQGLSGVGGGSGIYDLMGRYFYAGAVAKF